MEAGGLIILTGVWRGWAHWTGHCDVTALLTQYDEELHVGVWERGGGRPQSDAGDATQPELYSSGAARAAPAGPGHYSGHFSNPQSVPAPGKQQNSV